MSDSKGNPLEGISTVINGRHAFVHERVLEYIVRETDRSGGVVFRKRDMAEWLGCRPYSLDRAVRELRRDGFITVTPQFTQSGAQIGNIYSATTIGRARVSVWKNREQR